MQVLTSKILSMTLLGGISMVLGLLPLILRRSCNLGANSSHQVHQQFLLSALSCFGGGVILTTCFTHMLPEVNFFLAKNIKDGHFPDTGMAIAEILVLCGFFMIYIVEEVTHRVIHRLHHGGRRISEAQGNGHVSTNGAATVTSSSGDKEEVQPMYTEGHQLHVHEEVPTDLLDNMSKENSFQAALRGFLIILALSLHAVFEGIALGLTHTSSSVWFLFFAISCHKYVISFCVGMQFISSGVKTWLICAYVSTFALISPLGVGVGIALSETVESEASLQNSLVTILQGLATGTLLYVVFFEVIEKERLKQTSGVLQVTFLIFGFLTMLLFEWIGLQYHSETDIENLHESSSLSSWCTLTKVESFWQLPLNFTCQNTTLTPI